MKNEAIFDGGKNIANLIYEIRGKQVMLDSDLAMLYECKNGTKTINQAVKRHEDRFPEDFCFQIGGEELLRSQVGTANYRGKVELRSQLVTANENDSQSNALTVGNNMSRNNPWVFTEQGVAMLATVLRTEVASRVSVAIMRAFAAMRRYMADGLLEQKYINKLVLEHDERLNLVEETLSGFEERNNRLFFDGQIYDAYSLLKDILNKSKKEIVIIDNYIDKQLLDMLAEIGKNVTVVTNRYNNRDFNKYKKQYDNIEMRINDKIHDRFIIVDRKVLYHCGASFKDLGSKCFAINKIEDRGYLEQIIKYIG